MQGVSESYWGWGYCTSSICKNSKNFPICAILNCRRLRASPFHTVLYQHTNLFSLYKCVHSHKPVLSLQKCTLPLTPPQSVHHHKPILSLQMCTLPQHHMRPPTSQTVMQIPVTHRYEDSNMSLLLRNDHKGGLHELLLDRLTLLQISFSLQEPVRMQCTKWPDMWKRTKSCKTQKCS